MRKLEEMPRNGGGDSSNNEEANVSQTQLCRWMKEK